MKGLNRNKRRCWYALYEGKVPVTDEYGNETGESETLYSRPVSLDANISSASGESEYTVFGSNLQYDKSVIVFDPNLPVSENSLFWIDADVNEQPDYQVARISRSLNTIAIALTRIEIE